MAVRDDFAAGEVLTAADLNDTFAEKLPYSYGTATPSTTDSGFLWYDSNSTPAATKFWDGSAFVPFGGKILQVVRDTDTTQRTTTSTTFVDVTGLAVTITPQKSDSAIFIIASFFGVSNPSTTVDGRVDFAITNSSNSPQSGVEFMRIGLASQSTILVSPVILWAYDTPATTSAVTYKVRFKVANASNTGIVDGAVSTSQLYAIEVSA